MLTLNVYRPGTVDREAGAYPGPGPQPVGEGWSSGSRTCATRGALVTPEASALDLIDRLPEPVTGEVWSFGER